MDTLKFNLNQNGNRFKPLNATNGGPWYSRQAKNNSRNNFNEYKAARIPYSRNHDSKICPIYNGPFSHDISSIFPDFNADENDPASYDFACTDEEIFKCLEAGTETFYRLGQTIEHQVAKRYVYPPKDFNKWASICEHIIRHYNEGWSDGFNYNLQYWEIWNEPDLKNYNALTDSWWSSTWLGTKEQFFDLFAITAKHLKECFPNVKIGGPGLAGDRKWLAEFLSEMQKRNVPIDFLSWHIYCTEPIKAIKMGEEIRSLLDQNGYKNTESILNEWNYVKGWTGDNYQYSIDTKLRLKGSAFTLATVCASQHSTIDMLMYYDTRPSQWNGVFDYFTYKPLKGYYALYWYGMFYDCIKEIPCDTEIEDIYTLCGVKDDGKIIATVTHYTDKDFDGVVADKTVKLDFGRNGNFEIYLLDETHDGELITTTDCLELTLPVHTSILIKEI